MLGWEIYISRACDPNADLDTHRASALADWRASFSGGLDWLDTLVANGRAVELGGSGYPVSYQITAGVIAEVLGVGVPTHESPNVGRDESIPPGSKAWSETIDLERIKALDPFEVLVVEAWDQS